MSLLHKLAIQNYTCNNLWELIRISKKDSAVERFLLQKTKKESNKLHKLRKAVTQVPAR